MTAGQLCWRTVFRILPHNLRRTGWKCRSCSRPWADCRCRSVRCNSAHRTGWKRFPAGRCCLKQQPWWCFPRWFLCLMCSRKTLHFLWWWNPARELSQRRNLWSEVLWFRQKSFLLQLSLYRKSCCSNQLRYSRLRWSERKRQAYLPVIL